jgi:hypothetical protein
MYEARGKFNKMRAAKFKVLAAVFWNLYSSGILHRFTENT